MFFAHCYHNRYFFENLFVLSKNREFCFQFLQTFKKKIAFFVVFAKKYNYLFLADKKISEKLESMMWCDGLSTVEYLQNLCCFFDGKAEE